MMTLAANQTSQQPNPDLATVLQQAINSLAAVIESKPELILEHNLPSLQLMVNGAVIAGMTIAVRRCAREGKPLIVPAFFVDHDSADSPVNPSPFELLFVPMKMHGKVALVLVMEVPPPPM